LLTAASYLSADIVGKLGAYEREALELRELREEFAEMGQTLVNLD